MSQSLIPDKNLSMRLDRAVRFADSDHINHDLVLKVRRKCRMAFGMQAGESSILYGYELFLLFRLCFSAYNGQGVEELGLSFDRNRKEYIEFCEGRTKLPYEFLYYGSQKTEIRPGSVPPKLREEFVQFCALSDGLPSAGIDSETEERIAVFIGSQRKAVPKLIDLQAGS